MTLDPDVRRPAVAGRFYPADPHALRRLVEECLAPGDGSRERCPAAVVPHAGLRFSGVCAARVFSRLELPPVVIIIGPNHTGVFPAQGAASLSPETGFETPLGVTPVSRDVGERLRAATAQIVSDAAAHRDEHAIEVELPFLNVLSPQTAIVPLVLHTDNWDACRAVGQAIAAVVREWDEPILLLASSDMNHFESAAVAAKKDQRALDRVRRLDGAGLLETCRRDHVTMCGRGPTATVLEAARHLGATEADVVDYRHSGWVTGDDDEVVAYAGVVIR